MEPLRLGNDKFLKGHAALSGRTGLQIQVHVWFSLRLLTAWCPGSKAWASHWVIEFWLTTDGCGWNEIIFFLALREIIVEIHGLTVFGVLVFIFNLWNQSKLLGGQSHCSHGSKNIDLVFDLKLCFNWDQTQALWRAVAASLSAYLVACNQCDYCTPAMLAGGWLCLSPWGIWVGWSRKSVPNLHDFLQHAVIFQRAETEVVTGFQEVLPTHCSVETRTELIAILSNL